MTAARGRPGAEAGAGQLGSLRGEAPVEERATGWVRVGGGLSGAVPCFEDGEARSHVLG